MGVGSKVGGERPAGSGEGTGLALLLEDPGADEAALLQPVKSSAAVNTPVTQDEEKEVNPVAGLLGFILELPSSQAQAAILPLPPGGGTQPPHQDQEEDNTHTCASHSSTHIDFKVLGQAVKSRLADLSSSTTQHHQDPQHSSVQEEGNQTSLSADSKQGDEGEEGVPADVPGPPGSEALPPISISTSTSTSTLEHPSSPPGRLGPRVVSMDRTVASGDIRFDRGGLVLDSESNFSSCRANVCVHAGRWMFEATLLTAGIQQLGWATVGCPFTNEEGVGDAVDSYAFDGKRVKKWNVSCESYGVPWAAGDVIAAALDMDQGELTFYRNGVSLGLAFSSIRRGVRGLAYFPAISLSQGERCEVNFGGRPLSYPVPGYLPLQAPPQPHLLSQAHYLTRSLTRLTQVACGLSLEDLPGQPPAGDYMRRALQELAQAQRHTQPGVPDRGGQQPATQPTAGGSNVGEVKVAGHDVTGEPEEGLVLDGAGTRATEDLLTAPPATTTTTSRLEVVKDDRAAVDIQLNTQHGIQNNKDELVEKSKTCHSGGFSDPQQGVTAGGGEGPPPSRDCLGADDEVLLAALIMQHLAPLLSNQHVLELCLAPRLMDLQREGDDYGVDVGGEHSTLNRVLSLMKATMETHEISTTFMNLVTHLARLTRTCYPLPPPPAAAAPPSDSHSGAASCAPPPPSSSSACSSSCCSALALAAGLLHDTDILQLWVSGPSFSTELEWLLTRKQPNSADLALLLPKVWWHGASGEFALNQPVMQAACDAMSEAVRLQEHFQGLVVRPLLALRGPAPLGGSMGDGQQGGVFRGWLKQLLYKNRDATRNVPPPGLSESSVLVSTYFLLLRLLDPLLQEALVEATTTTPPSQGTQGGRGGSSHAPLVFPTHIFLNAHAEKFDFPRLGGTLSHLKKALPLSSQELQPISLREMHLNQLSPAPPLSQGVSKEGESSDVAGPRGCGGEASSAGAATAEVAAATTGQQQQQATPPRHSGACQHNTTSSLIREYFGELVDALQVVYLLSLASTFKSASYQLQTQMQNIAQLEETNRRLRQCEVKTRELVRHLKEAREVYREDVVESVRGCAWVRATLFQPGKQLLMFNACHFIVSLLLATSTRTRLFSYIPELYVEAVMDCFHALRRGDPPFTPPPPPQGEEQEWSCLGRLVRFLVQHVSDSRVVNPDIRDVLLQSISVLLQYKEYVGAFETSSTARALLVRSLLSSFDGRFWIPISNILLRLVKGRGFGQRVSRRLRGSSQECSSPVFQQVLRVTCENDVALGTAFLNRIFNTLNWTLTEFCVTMKEMQDAITRRQVADLQQHQRKCTIMFELSVNLERILEFLTLELPQFFICPSSTSQHALPPPPPPASTSAAAASAGTSSSSSFASSAPSDSSALLPPSPPPPDSGPPSSSSLPVDPTAAASASEATGRGLAGGGGFGNEELNLTRLCESLVFLLNHTTTGPDSRLFESTLRLQMQPLEKINRALILAPCVGILLNLHQHHHKQQQGAQQPTPPPPPAPSTAPSSEPPLPATTSTLQPSASASHTPEEPGNPDSQVEVEAETDLTLGPGKACAGDSPQPSALVRVLASMEASCSLDHFNYLCKFNWPEAFPEDLTLLQVNKLTEFVSALRLEVDMHKKRGEEAGARRRAERRAAAAESVGKEETTTEADDDDTLHSDRVREELEDESLCTICYCAEADTVFQPCGHQSCRRCISRQMLNRSKCFFCNAAVTELTDLQAPTPGPPDVAAVSPLGDSDVLFPTPENPFTSAITHQDHDCPPLPPPPTSEQPGGAGRNPAAQAGSQPES